MVRNKFLLDTHIFIWWMEKNNKLPEEIFAIINSQSTELFISVASIWEIIIKKMKKKLKLSEDIQAGIKKSNFKVLPIELLHVLGIETLPHIHKDPFDRIIVAQSKAENLTVITHDKKIWKYNIKVLKA